MTWQIALSMKDGIKNNDGIFFREHVRVSRKRRRIEDETEE
jgi:hypothetical protein